MSACVSQQDGQRNLFLETRHVCQWGQALQVVWQQNSGMMEMLSVCAVHAMATPPHVATECWECSCCTQRTEFSIIFNSLKKCTYEYVLGLSVVVCCPGFTGLATLPPPLLASTTLYSETSLYTQAEGRMLPQWIRQEKQKEPGT